MDSTDHPHDIRSALGQLALINRITLALSAAVSQADLLNTIAVALTSPLGLRFSRAFLLLYDSRRECFHADRVAGISSTDQARTLFEKAEAEREYLQSLTGNLAESPHSEATELMDQLKSGALLIESMQRADDQTMPPPGWSDLHVIAKCYPTDRVFERLTQDSRVICYDRREDLNELPTPLNVILETPFVAFSIHTTKGVRLAVLADRAYQENPELDKGDLSLLEWFRSQAGMVWAGAEAYADLESALKQLRDVDLLKTGFLSTISHELRTPLTAVLGFLNLIVSGRSGPLTDEQRDLLTRSRRQADHLLGLVNDLLELAEFQADEVREMPLEPVDPHAAFEAAQARIAAGPRGGQATIVWQTATDASCSIIANQSALERILYHLLDNAVKFSRGGGEVTVECDKVGEHCHVSIADGGIGIERAKLGEIFSHFYQVDSRLSRNFPGMGIGLTLVKLLLNATQGHIAVLSRPGEGSVFTVVYPLAVSKPSGRKG